MSKHAVSPLLHKPNKHGLEYNAQFDLAGFTEAEQSLVNWNDFAPDLSIYYYIHVKYGLHRWIGETEDHCVVCRLGGHEVSNKNAWYADYNIREWTP
jgi:hypothetical protein